MVVLGVAGLLLVGALPQLGQGFVTLRSLVVAAVTAAGLTVVAVLARGRDAAARWLLAYLAWALVSALASGAVRMSLYGGFGTDRGWVYLVAFGACWGLGRALGPWGRAVLPWVIAGGVALSSLVGVMQLALELGGDLAPLDGRANGLTASSIYLGSVAAGGLALVVALVLRAGSRWWGGVAVVALVAAAVAASGSRVALFAGIVLALVLVVRTRSPRGTRHQVVRGVVVFAAIASGTVWAAGLSTSSGVNRAAERGSGGLESRVIMWRAGLHAAAERPVTGWGPGRFRPAASPRTTAAFVRSDGPDREFFDAHNVVVEHVVGEGVVGLVLLGGFAVASARRARGPLAWFTAGVAITWLLEPASVATAPIALLALAAAMSPPSRVPGLSTAPAARRAVGVGALVVATAVGVLAGAAVVAADVYATRAVESASVADARRAQRFLPPDPVLADLERQALTPLPFSKPTNAQRAAVVRAARRVTRLDPTRAQWWVNLGFAEGSSPRRKVDALRESEAAFAQALRRNPWSVGALDGMRRVAQARGDDAEAARWAGRLCEAWPDHEVCHREGRAAS